MRAADQLPTEHGTVWRRAVALVVLCLALAAVASSEDLHAALLDVLKEIEQIIQGHPILGATVFVVFAAVSAMIAFVSVAVVVPVAIYAWGQGVTILLLWLGWILGGLCAYGIARYMGRSVVRWLTAEAGLKRLESAVNSQTPLSLVLLLQLALPSEIPGYLLGLVRYPLPRYLAALALAELPYALATVLLGASFLERRSGVLLAVGLVLVASSLFAFQRLRRRLAPGSSRPAGDGH
ncbi:MAG: VTT domain-containing protein [Steroidobacteraceae bacterium]